MLRIRSALVATCGLFLSCSLINNPDDVKPASSDGAGGSSGGNGGNTSNAGGSAGESTDVGGSSSVGGSSTSDSGGTGGSAGEPSTGGTGGVGGSNSAGGATSSGGASSSGGTTGGGGTTTTGGTGGTMPVPPTLGLLAVGGVDSDTDDSVLSMLSADTGDELASEPLQVGGIAYDGAPGRDVWFIFTSSQFPPDPAQPVDLEVRRFNDQTEEWTTLSKLTAIPPPRPGQFSVLNDRLVYLSFRLQNNMPVEHLTVLDTSDLTDIQLLTSDFTTTDRMIGITGARGSANDSEALGGIVNIMLAQECTDTMAVSGCALVVQPIFFGSQETVGVPVDISMIAGSRLQGQTGFYTARLAEETHIAMPNDEGRVYVAVADPRSPGDLADFNPTTATAIGGLAISECNRVAAFTKGPEGQLYAFNLDGALGNFVDLMHAGQAVHYESFEEQVIVTFKPPAAAEPAVPLIRAFRTDRNGVGVAISQRTEFVAPANLVPDTLATRIALPIECP